MHARNVCRIQIFQYSSQLRPLRKTHKWLSTESSAIGFRRHYVQLAVSSETPSRHHAPLLKAQPLRLAIIGSGPAGFYSARRLQQRLGEDGVQIDMFERLPVPFGLVRFGVAPDHPEVKKCIDTFDEVASFRTFRFVGNVNVGTDVPLEVLRSAYDGILFAYGAAADRKLNIPGEDKLEETGRAHGQSFEGTGGVYSARTFVGWYNGLPEYAHLNPRLDADGDTAVVIGQGNVALDVARVLLSDVDRLRNTDMAEHALAALSKRTIKRVHIVGRRGPMQAAFTIKELRELVTLEGVAFQPVQPSLLPEIPKTLPRAKRRIAELLIKHSSTAEAAAETWKENDMKMWSLDFMKSPTAFLEDTGHLGRLGAVKFKQTRFTSDTSDTNDPGARVETADQTEIIPASLAFRSIGYKSVALPGMESLGINFDSRRGIVPNIGGRVITSTGEQIDGLYCTGWVKNGPTGVIATTMEDAFAAAETIVEDWTAKKEVSHDVGGWDQIKSQVTSRPIVTWDDWLKIDRAEVTAGRAKGKEREKFTSVEQMLQVPR